MIRIRHGILNTLEHGLVRAADALVALLLIRHLFTEQYSMLAVAAALAAPFLFFFVCPESILYREFGQWKELGKEKLAARIHAIRLFGLSKIAVAAIVSIPVAYFGFEVEFKEAYWAMIWAFATLLSPQMSGADREFLRFDLKLRALNLITIYQKATLLGGVTFCIYKGETDSFSLAIIALFSGLSTALLSFVYVYRIIGLARADFGIVRHSIRSFSLWQHLSGVVLNWIQTMDVFFMGLLRLPVFEIGLYASAWKLANLSTAIPQALSNVFTLWISRQTEGKQSLEKSVVKKYSFLLFGFTALQSALLWLLSPLIFEFLSNGRWSLQHIHQMIDWLAFMLIGATLYCGTLIMGMWMMVRGVTSEYFKRVSIPWLIASLLIYASAISLWGFYAAAVANVGVSLVVLILHLLYYGEHFRTRLK